MNQFSEDDERIGHRRMLDNIRAEQVRNEPEPDHYPSWTDIHTYNAVQPVGRYWCCEWHKHHKQSHDTNHIIEGPRS